MTRTMIAACSTFLVVLRCWAEPDQDEWLGPLCPTNARLVVVTPKCEMWARTTKNIGTPDQMKSHVWRFWKTTYYTVGSGFTNTYTTVEPLKCQSTITLSPGGSAIVDGGVLFLSAADAESVTNRAALRRLNFSGDRRSLDGWTLTVEDLPSGGALQTPSGMSPVPQKTLRVKTRNKTGATIPLYAYDFAGIDRPYRGDWQDRWPLRMLDLFNNQMIIWNGRAWQDVRLASLTRVVAGIDIDYIYDIGGVIRTQWWRLTYRLEDDGTRGVACVSVDTIHGRVFQTGGITRGGGRAVAPLDAEGIQEAERIVRNLPPSTGDGLTNWVLRVTDSGDPRIGRAYVRAYPCSAVPTEAMRLIELMGGLQFEAAEILKLERKRE